MKIKSKGPRPSAASSYQWILRAMRRLFGGGQIECGIPDDTGAGRNRYEQVVEARRFEADGRHYQDLRRGWRLGSEAFRKELLKQTGKWLASSRLGKERRETAEAGARRTIAETLRKGRLMRFRRLSNH